MTAYYNELDHYAAHWLRNLIAHNLIAPGDVDERDIRDVCPGDLAGYSQHHFFAGIGGWSYALRLAGWPDDRPVWTGSCPCQPFSQAGARKGTADERHLWPAWFHLVEQCRPPVLFSEQVASKDGLAWLDLVCSDLEGAGYTVGAIDLCAASIGAPHIRQRLWFVADANIGRWTDSFGLGNSSGSELERRKGKRKDNEEEQPPSSGASSFWSHCDWLLCRDGKSRPVKPGLLPLAHGVPARVAQLRAVGNAIVPQVAEAVIRSSLDLLYDQN